MSRLTVITDASGAIVAIGHGHLSEPANGGSHAGAPRGGLRAGPNQRLHEIEVATEIDGRTTWKHLHEAALSHVSR